MTQFLSKDLSKVLNAEAKYLKTLTLPQALKIAFGASKIEVCFIGAHMVEIRILEQYEEVKKNEQ